MSDQSPAQKEFDAMKIVYEALEPLEDDARERVVKHVAGMLEISVVMKPGKPDPVVSEADQDSGDAATVAAAATSVPAFKNFAELFAAADPETTAHKALVAGYWIQVSEGNPSFEGQRANKELAHLGHKLANITNAVDTLKAQKPALVIQTKKSGTSQQARKTYMVTHAGIEAVKAMLNG
jgi:hypothetical protein